MYDIIIIGAGASGLSAALKASMIDSKLQILVLEKEAKCGRKLSASGNGKCNLTNSVFSKDCYHSIIGDLPSVFVENHNIDEVTDFFHDLGILTYDNNGYYYPISNKALQVTSALVKMCLLRGVEIINSCVVTSIKKINENDGYSVLAKDASYYGRNVILAAGSCASPMLGGCSLGYELAEQLGFTVTDLYPGLTPIYVDDKKVSSNNLYDEFLKSYTEFINKVGNSYDNSQKIQRLYTVEDAKQPRISNTKKVLNKVKNVFNKKDKGNTVSDGTADVVSKVTLSLAVPFYWPVELFSIKKSKSEIRDQQFRCSILMFYLNWLPKFME